MSLQRRLLLYLLICAPLVWGVALYFSIDRAKHQINELYDTELIRLARQLQSTVGPTLGQTEDALPPAPQEGAPDAGESDVRDLAVAVWDQRGQLMVSDREGVQLPNLPNRSGFVDESVAGRQWRVYYLQSLDGRWQVAAGQAAYERDELIYGLMVSQVAPWLLVLPFLLAVMAWAVRRALAPIADLAAELTARNADDLQPIPDKATPAELRPMLRAMNGLFTRIEALLVRERRFTADAAHELRTPLAVLRAQWDVVRRAGSAEERAQSEMKLDAGLDRMERLVTQMLALSRVESGVLPVFTEVTWPPIVEQAMSDCLPLATRRRIELACEWPPEGRYPMPLMGDIHLLTVLLRNLLDNAVRYAPEGTAVVLRFAQDTLTVDNAGGPLSAEALTRLGERFYRPDGQQEIGSGLGVSIVHRIAELHGLEVVFGTATQGQGVRVQLRFDAVHR
ncbi:ATP-binding protein [Variovorax guangxiensis]|uniref:histidine kinase n=1 Tax=Variovorax guangxiensis TaxID=1775474 RepID=A0A502DGL7_9BURK|nr:ATP-binding protein [Variovorax guangxiensis]RZI66516.1 MAG: two-component sensor histidine kinase [Variovorax sp.]TPG17685.1 two-component sensor histidine kinase [Variovorax ginsengisoli]TPG23599.1 two-component sensor histidine kinase [Variovorax guangxiensis]